MNVIFLYYFHWKMSCCNWKLYSNKQRVHNLLCSNEPFPGEGVGYQLRSGILPIVAFYYSQILFDIIIHKYYSILLFTNIIRYYYSQILFDIIIRKYYSILLFTNIIRYYYSQILWYYYSQILFDIIIHKYWSLFFIRH